MINAPKILVVGGGGVCGLAAGIALSEHGFRPDVVELHLGSRPPQIGLVVHSNFVRAMGALGIGKAVVRAGFIQEGTRYTDVNGNVLNEVRGSSGAGTDFPSDLGLPLPALYKLLTDRLAEFDIPIQLGTTFTSIIQDEDGVDVTFSDGSEKRYDLVVGADGMRSKVRAQIFGTHIQPEYSGVGVWRCPVTRPGDLNWSYVYTGNPRGTAGYYPLDAETMYVMLTGAERADADFPEATLAAELRLRLEGFNGDLAHIRDHEITDARLVMYSPIEVLLLPRPWYRGRVILIGDAAHATTPHLAQSAAMALEDAIVLGDELSSRDPMPEVLVRVMDRRYERVKFFWDASMRLAQQEMHPEEAFDMAAFLAEVKRVTSEPI